MPIYEYLCEKCGHEFEREQRISEDPLRSCPACRGRRVKRLISQTSFVLKGGGWYSDLYSRPSATKQDSAASSSSSESGEPAKSSESKSKSDSSGDSKIGRKTGKKADKKSAA